MNTPAPRKRRAPAKRARDPLADLERRLAALRAQDAALTLGHIVRGGRGLYTASIARVSHRSLFGTVQGFVFESMCASAAEPTLASAIEKAFALWSV